MTCILKVFKWSEAPRDFKKTLPQKRADVLNFLKTNSFLKKREERTCTKILIEMLELVMNSMKQSINENQKCYEGHELRYIELKWSEVWPQK